MKQLEGAEQAYADAIGIYRVNESRNALHMANALRGLALISEAQGLASSATDRWQQAGRLYAELGIQAGADESERRLRNLASA